MHHTASREARSGCGRRPASWSGSAEVPWSGSVERWRAVVQNACGGWANRTLNRGALWPFPPGECDKSWHPLAQTSQSPQDLCLEGVIERRDTSSGRFSSVSWRGGYFGAPGSAGAATDTTRIGPACTVRGPKVPSKGDRESSDSETARSAEPRRMISERNRGVVT